MVAAGILTFRLAGVFRVTGPNGTDRTPRSMKSRGVLALLLDAPEYCRARSFLQDHLWSDRQPEQGASSLRQALSDVRRAFGPHRDALHTEGRLVRLCSDFVRTEDLPQRTDQTWELLEDLDIRDPEFEDWLRDRRQRVAAPETEQVQLQTSVEQVAPSLRPQLIVEGLEADDDNILARYLSGSIAKGVSDRGTLDVLNAQGNGEDVGDHRAARLLLNVDERRDSGGSLLSLQLRSLDSPKVLWSTISHVAPEGNDGLPLQLAPLVGLGIDQIVTRLVADEARSENPPGSQSGGSLFPIVDEMLRTRARDYAGLNTRLAKSFETDKRGVTLAWQALLRAFAFGERHREDAQLMREEANELLAYAMELEPQNPVVLGLAAHVFTFLLERPRVAIELGNRSLRIDPANVFGWSSIGYARLALGDLEDSYAALTQARRLTGEGPYRSMLDFLFGMSAIVSGRFEEGISTLETVNALAPDFQPPLRYLLAGYLASGDHAMAEETVAKLTRIEPGFDLLDFGEPDYPTPALRNNKLINLKKLPKFR